MLRLLGDYPVKKIIMKAAVCAALVTAPAALLAQDAMPVNGQSMEQVRASLGNPIEIKGPVGIPAITTWEYNGFSVYFENNLVITSVAD